MVSAEPLLRDAPRVLLHSGFGLLIAVLVAGGGRSYVLVLLAGLAVVLCAAELARARAMRMGALFVKIAGPFMAPEERHGRPVTGIWALIGIGLVLLIFPLESALVGILYFALADPAARVAGGITKRWGKRREGKTISGSISFLLVATAVSSGIGLGVAGSLSAAALAAAAERLLDFDIVAGGPDDNFFVPVVGAAAHMMMSVL